MRRTAPRRPEQRALVANCDEKETRDASTQTGGWPWDRHQRSGARWEMGCLVGSGTDEGTEEFRRTVLVRGRRGRGKKRKRWRRTESSVKCEECEGVKQRC